MRPTEGQLLEIMDEYGEKLSPVNDARWWEEAVSGIDAVDLDGDDEDEDEDGEGHWVSICLILMFAELLSSLAVVCHSQSSHGQKPPCHASLLPSLM